MSKQDTVDQIRLIFKKKDIASIQIDLHNMLLMDTITINLTRMTDPEEYQLLYYDIISKYGLCVYFLQEMEEFEVCADIIDKTILILNDSYNKKKADIKFLLSDSITMYTEKLKK